MTRTLVVPRLVCTWEPARELQEYWCLCSNPKDWVKWPGSVPQCWDFSNISKWLYYAGTTELYYSLYFWVYLIICRTKNGFLMQWGQKAVKHMMRGRGGRAPLIWVWRTHWSPSEAFSPRPSLPTPVSLSLGSQSRMGTCIRWCNHINPGSPTNGSIHKPQKGRTWV